MARACSVIVGDVVTSYLEAGPGASVVLLHRVEPGVTVEAIRSGCSTGYRRD